MSLKKPWISVPKKKSDMKIKINNKEVETTAKTVAELAAEQKLPEKGVAIAISNNMVPRTEWNNRLLNEGDDIVILKAFCGG